MTKVFIAGSIKIKKLDEKLLVRINNIVEEKLDVVVGDANGADSSIQMELDKRGAQNVTVYCTGKTPRNNIGNWPIKTVHSAANPGTRAFFTAKDKEMANDADYGLMVWDAASTGTLSNAFEMAKAGKKCVVFVNKIKEFVTVSEPEDMRRLISFMTSGAIKQAEKKIGLQKILSETLHTQFSLSI